jgi:Stage II sporulation protein E (SpoIIE)
MPDRGRVTARRSHLDQSALVDHAAATGLEDFVTGVIGRVDLRSGSVELVNAGHVEPYLIRGRRSGRWPFRQIFRSACSVTRLTARPESTCSPATAWCS